MTPDLKRLCFAAEQASRADNVELTDGEIEAIVRAVLNELAPPSGDMEQIAARYSVEIGGQAEGLCEVICDGFTAMIDHILAEPTTA